MSTDSHARRYRFQPAIVEPLERREVPSSSSVPVDLRNLSATVTGSAHPTSMNGNSEVDFTASGKDTQGHPLRLKGSLVTFDPASYSYIAGTHGSATLTTRHASYHFNLNGPSSDLNSASGLSNVNFSITKSGQPRKHLIVVSVGSIQIHREVAEDGSQQVTATIVASAPWKTRAKRS